MLDESRDEGEHPTVLVRRSASASMPTEHGEFLFHVYESLVDGQHHVAAVKGAPSPGALVRVHSECLTGDVFGSRRCDCGAQIDAAMAAIAAEGTGAIVYLRGHEGRGIGIEKKIRAYELQDVGLDTVDANLELGLPVDGRNYAVAAQILRDLGLTSVRLLTNNPDKEHELARFGIEIVGRVPSPTEPNPHNIRYLRTKRDRMGHLLDGLDAYEQPDPEPAGSAGPSGSDLAH